MATGLALWFVQDIVDCFGGNYIKMIKSVLKRMQKGERLTRLLWGKLYKNNKIGFEKDAKGGTFDCVRIFNIIRP